MKLTDKQFNPRRKRLLSSIEQKQQPSDAELGFYGLTVYYGDETLSSSLLSKTLIFQNERRKIQHISDRDCFFMPLQEDALHFVEKHKRSILMAPTSFGKTLIAKEYIYRVHPRVVVFIVPTNSLAYELENDFKKNTNFSSYKIFDRQSGVDIEGDGEDILFIGTQEKYLEVEKSLQNIDFFVIDEAYKLSESTTEQRGYKLAKSFLDSISKRSNKVCLLCPNARLVGFENYDIEVFSTEFNAVDNSFTLLSEDDFYQRVNQESRHDKTILYCQSPSDINECFEKIEPHRLSDDREFNRFIRNLADDFHPEWSIVKYLRKGVLVHHGQMPKYLQNKLLRMFLTEGKYNLLLGTRSISEGINTPSKNVFIHPQCKIDDDRMVIKNTIGRAGRLGRMPIGHIYAMTNLNEVIQSKVEITLSVSDESQADILKETEDADRIKAFAKANGLSAELVSTILRDNKISLTALRKMLDAFQTDIKFGSYSSLPFITRKALSEYLLIDSRRDAIYIRGVFQNSYHPRSAPNQNRFLISFVDRVAFFRDKYKEQEKMSDSDIVDGYMKFIYSALDHKLLLIASVADQVAKGAENWPFGKNVKEAVSSFQQSYFKFCYGTANLDKFTESQKKILQSLREFGVSFSDPLISVKIVYDIEKELKVRYSEYDIVNAIRRLANEDTPNKGVFKRILEKYL